MQWVSDASMLRIDAGAKLLGARRNGSRRDFVAIMVMYLAPEEPDELWKVLDPYLRVQGGAKGKGRYSALMTKLPSPVSLRLDALVARASTQSTAYRQDLVGALAMQRPLSRDRLIQLHETYWDSVAADAALAGMRKRDFLSPNPPQPGRRPAAARRR